MQHLHILLIFLVAMWFFAPDPALGQGLARDWGFYLGLEMGTDLAPEMNFTGSSNDRASVCDEYINPMYATVTQTAGYEDYNCTGPNRGVGDDWDNSFNSTRAILSGFVLGYRAGENNPDGLRFRLRPEFEYFYRAAPYEQTSDIPFAAGASGDKLRQELWVATDRIDTLAGHNLFGNLYLDFTNSTRITPYIGWGMGAGFARMGYSGVWGRNADPSAIGGLDGSWIPGGRRRWLGGSPGHYVRFHRSIKSGTLGLTETPKNHRSTQPNHFNEPFKSDTA